MPIVRMGYGYGLVGLGADTAQTPTLPNTASPTIPAGYGFMDGLKVWTNPSQIWPAVQNLGAIFQVSPMAALGFLLPVLGAGFLLLGGAAGGGYVYAKRRARRAAGTVPNPRRSRRGRRRNPHSRYAVSSYGKGTDGRTYYGVYDHQEHKFVTRPQVGKQAVSRLAASHNLTAGRIWGKKRNPGKKKRPGNRRSNPGHRPLYWVAYGKTIAGGTQAAKTNLAQAKQSANRIAVGGQVATVWKSVVGHASKRVYQAPSRGVR